MDFFTGGGLIMNGLNNGFVSRDKRGLFWDLNPGHNGVL